MRVTRFAAKTLGGRPVEVVDVGPADELGRRTFCLTWVPDGHPWCPACGGALEGHACRRCGADSRGRPRGQVFRTRLEERVLVPEGVELP